MSNTAAMSSWQGWSIPPSKQSNDDEGKPPKCECGERTVKKVFATFEYFFCPKCKEEVNKFGAKVVTNGR